jgi:hypothetical protein
MDVKLIFLKTSQAVHVVQHIPSRLGSVPFFDSHSKLLVNIERLSHWLDFDNL